MKKILRIIVLIVLCNSTTIYGIDKIGVELDLYPFVTGGNYMGAYVAQNGFKYRVIRAESNMPEFMLQNNIENVNLEVYAFIVDYYFDETDYKGLWFGIGGERWNNRIDEKNGVKNVGFSQNIFTFGGGYLFELTDRIFINPWAAVHVNMGNEREKIIGDTSYEIKKIIPEVSVKLGYSF